MPPLDPDIIEMIRRMVAAGFSVERIAAITTPHGPRQFTAQIVACAQEEQKKAAREPEPDTALMKLNS
ncbi:MAG: hypothetical protein BroJett011_62200 [Chloroflexota bacterium]|nr:MAG: hypothetical protein BroJett011_62200 [Chloroflexota bacterium]